MKHRWLVELLSFPGTALLLLLLFTTATVRAASGGACTLECPVDAPCTVGQAQFTHSNDVVQLATSVQGMHCACPPGWTGVLCDHRYESCNAGSHDCFHGGRCVSGDASMVDAFGNPQLLCDCSNAQTTDTTNNGGGSGIQYVGKYCETPFEKACSASDNSLFCVNGADCNPNYE